MKKQDLVNLSKTAWLKKISIKEPAEPAVVEEKEEVDPMIANTEPYTIRKGDWLSKKS